MLRRHAEGGLSGAEEDVLIAHLDTCEVCQQTLELLAAGGPSLLEAVREVGQEEGSPPASLLEARSAPESAEGGEPSLDFLGPPGSPESLGTLGHFEVLGVIGRGGMGLVLKAADSSLGRVVAIKVMASQLAANPEARMRFAREARAAASVSHEHAVAIHAVEESAGVPYLVMEYVAGQSLEQRLAGAGRLEVPEAVRIGVETAAGLAAAHAQGLIHRDIKPANILIEEGSGRVKLTDFGLARAAGEANLTRSGTVAGTPRYMAPEQANGDPVDHRADVYALGVTLYEALTGRPAFAGESVLEVLRRVASEEPAPPRRVNPSVPVDLETVVLKAMAKVPAERYAGVEELAEDLRRVRDDRPIRARRPTLWQRTVKWSRRNRSLVLLSVAAVVSVLAVSTAALAVSNVWISAALGERTEALVERTRALGAERKANDALEVALEREKGTVYWSKVRLADHEWWANNVWRAEQLLEGCSPERRGWEWHYLRRRCHTHIFRPGNKGFPFASVAVSPDGTRIACQFLGDPPTRDLQIYEVGTGLFVRSLSVQGCQYEEIQFSPVGNSLVASGRDRWIHVWDLKEGRRKLEEVGVGLSPTRGALSVDGRRFAFAKDREMLVCDVETGNLVRSITGFPFRSHNPLTFLPGGQMLASVLGGGGLVLLDVGSGKNHRQLMAHPDLVSCLACSRDGLLLAAGGRTGTLSVWEAVTGRQKVILAGHTDWIFEAVFSADGKFLATGSRDRTARVWDLHTGQNVRTFRGHRSAVRSLGFSADGTRLVTAGFDGTVRTWDCQNPQETRVLSHADSRAKQMAFSPDSRHLAVACASIRLPGKNRLITWDVAKGARQASLIADTGPVSSLAYRRDGLHLVAGGEDGLVRVWDVETGKLIHRLPTPTQPVLAAVYSPDQRHLVSVGPHGDLCRWDAATGERRQTLRGGPMVNGSAAVFTPDGQHVVLGTKFGGIHIRDVATGREERTFNGYRGHVRDLALTGDGRLLAAATYCPDHDLLKGWRRVLLWG